MYRICLRRALLIGSLWAVNIVVRPGPLLHTTAAASYQCCRQPEPPQQRGRGTPVDQLDWRLSLRPSHSLGPSSLGDAIKDPIRDCCSDCGSVQITVDVDKFRQTSFGIGN